MRLMQIMDTCNDHIPFTMNAASSTQDYHISHVIPKRLKRPLLPAFQTVYLIPSLAYIQISLLSPPPSVALPSTAQSLLNATVSVAA